jgi:hypothetical protein
MSARASAVLLACISVALAVGAVARSAAGHAPSFAAPNRYATGGGPVTVNASDLNGDGRLDLVSANFRASSLSVLLNDGDGFAHHRDYATGPQPLTVEHVIDLNGDGALDLVTTAWPDWPLGVPDEISVLLNAGGGAFPAHVEYPAQDGLSLVVDLNGDERPDLVTCAETRISVRFNQGDGTFAAGTSYPSTSCASAASDVNGDGSLDLLGGGDGRILVFLNRGDGTFQAAHEYRTRTDGGLEAVGDLNSDGRQDAVTLSQGDYTVSVLLNSGDGGFDARSDYRTSKVWYLIPDGIAIDDLNHDGAPDLVFGSFNLADDSSGLAGIGAVFVLLNEGDGTFAAARSYKTSTSDWPPSLADLNGDGAPDLLYGDKLLLNRGDGRFAAPLEFGQMRTISDFNGDGRLDFAWAGWPRNTVAVRLNTPGLCNVQLVLGFTVSAARRKLARVNCRAAKVRRRYSAAKRGRVISQKPAAGAVRPGGTKVVLVVSLGRKR